MECVGYCITREHQGKTQYWAIDGPSGGYPYWSDYFGHHFIEEKYEDIKDELEIWKGDQRMCSESTPIITAIYIQPL